MFHAIKLERIEFKSNPELEPRPVLETSTNENCDPVNRFVMQKRSNRGLAGAHYDPSVMSLRARLARGLDIQRVNYGVTENDLNKLRASAMRLSTSIIDASNARAAAAVQEPISEPSKSE